MKQLTAKARTFGMVFAAAAFMATSPLMVPSAHAQGIGDFIASLSVDEGFGSFRGPAGNAVTIQHFIPAGNCPAPAIIIIHGIDGLGKYHQEYEVIGKELAVKGYAAFIVSYYEGSPGLPLPNPDVDRIPDPRAFQAWYETIRGSISYVQGFPGVDCNRVGILGMSLGAFLGTSVASTDPRVKCIAELSGGIPPAYAKKLRHMPPTLIIHGDHDPDVPVAEAMKLNALLNTKHMPHKTILLPCEGHLPYQRYKDFAAQAVLEFFDNTL